MSIDLILWGATKADFRTFAVANNLLTPFVDEDGNTSYDKREGFDYVWWAGSGKLKTAEGEYDGFDEITPPTFLPGFVALLKIHGSFFNSDRISDGITGEEDEVVEQWQKSKVVRYIKNNGTPGTIGVINYYELDGIRIFRPKDVTDWLAANNLPGHVWLGGNSY